MKVFVFFVCAPFSNVFSGNTMIFGNQNGNPSKRCRKIGSGQFECEAKRKEKALLAIPKNYQRTKLEPSLLITETGTVTSFQIENTLDPNYFISNGCTATFKDRFLIFGLHYSVSGPEYSGRGQWNAVS